MKGPLLLAAFVTVASLAPVAARQRMSLEQLKQVAQPVGAEPIEVLELEKVWAGVEPLLRLATSRDVDIRVRNAAVRALGRLEDPRAVPQLLALPSSSVGNAARADAVAQSLHGFDPSLDPSLVRAATAWMFDIGSSAITNRDQLAAVMTVMEPLSVIRYPTADEVHKAEAVLLKIVNFSAPDFRLAAQYEEAIRAFESLARTNQRVTALDEASADRLRKAARGDSRNDSDATRFYAFLALNAGRSLDRDTLTEGLSDDYWQLRHAAAAVVAGAGGGLDDESRSAAIQSLLEDTSPQVRYEAVRGFARRSAATLGCAPLEAMLKDPDRHVALAAIDALGDACRSDTELTDRIAAEVRVPPTIGSWHLDAHAFVALAKRDAARAAPSMEAFVTHPVWWVRMYAAGAAAVAGDLLHLEKLAYDANDNVREAALGAWRRLKKTEADPAIVEALERTDVQLVRQAASLLKDSPPSNRTYRVLTAALTRLTREGKETSRDARLMLLEAIAIHGSTENANELVPLLKDFDPKVAEKAAQQITSWTGKQALPEPLPYRRGWPQEYKDLKQCVAVQMSQAGTFKLQMDPASAPVAVDRFLKLALRDKYYNGLTIHRVVPNFVVQGGSPNANEYAGAKEFMRDEIAGRNTRGTVGLSTRGRNTADAQFFINLIDNPRLNGDYTVFARVPTTDFPVVDKIQEGDVITSIDPSKCEGM